MSVHFRLLRGLLLTSGLLFALSAGAVLAPSQAGAQTQQPAHEQRAGKYAVDLRVPREGLFADQETDVEFHVSDASQDDPVQGPPPIVRAAIAARVTMPAMASMPAQLPRLMRRACLATTASFSTSRMAAITGWT